MAAGRLTEIQGTRGAELEMIVGKRGQRDRSPAGRRMCLGYLSMKTIDLLDVTMDFFVLWQQIV